MPIEPMETESKSIFTSKTFWGAIIAGLSTLAAIFGVDITGDQQATIVNGIAAVGGAVGVVLTIYGRMTAKKPIG